mgnify:CR=1 FL=1
MSTPSFPWREAVRSLSDVEAPIPPGQAVELFGTDRVGGEGEVRFGVFTAAPDLLAATGTVLRDGTWRVSIHRLVLNQQPGDMRSWR